MRISREADYAIRIIMYLSSLEEGGKTGAKAISESMHIPERFNLKILRKLTVEGLTCSFRGVYGGYALAKLASEITLKDVIECIDGPISLNRCLYDPDFCSRQAVGTCAVHGYFEDINYTVKNYLDSITFQNIINNDREANKFKRVQAL